MLGPTESEATSCMLPLKKKKNFTESFSVFKSQLLLKGNMLPVVQKNALLMKLYIKRTMIRFHSILSSV